MKQDYKTGKHLSTEMPYRVVNLGLENHHLKAEVPESLSPEDKPPSKAKPGDLSALRFHTDKVHKYHISELIDLHLLEQLLKSFYDITGIRYTIIDTDNNILCRAGWTELCLNFHRNCPATEERCKLSNSYISQYLQYGSYTKFRCLNGLIDYATPVMVNGEHLATIYLGQVLEEPPDEEYFRKQAREFGFDEEAYIRALRKISIVPESEIKPIMRFYSQVAQVLASMGLERMQKLEAADQALKNSEERLRLVLEASKDGFWDLDIEKDYLYVSPRWAEMLEYSPDELKMRFDAWTRLIHPDDYCQTMKAISDHLKGKTAQYEAEYRLLTKSGKWKWMLDRGKVVSRDENGRPLRAAGTCIDITERKLAENALRLSEEKFSKVFHQSPIMMTLSTVGDEGVFIDANEALFNGMGYSPEEIIDRPVDEISFFRDPETKYDIQNSFLDNGKLEGIEIDYRTKSGEIRRGLLWSHPLHLNGSPCRITSLIDITEQRRIEQEMARLSDLNLIGTMAASIGHEIRNPMTSVRGFLQLFREKYHEDIDFIDLMIEELDRANKIITDFLGMARDKTVHLQPQSIDQVVMSIYPMLEAEAKYRGMLINLELNDPPKLSIDQDEIRQVIVNLAFNSLEAMSQGGTLTIGTMVEGRDTVLYVKDQGPGIEPELIDKLGTPFVTTKDNGTGLGLALCYSIAARHNARLEVATGADGTTFKLRFLNGQEE